MFKACQSASLFNVTLFCKEFSKMDINRFAVEALLFFSSAALLSQLAKYIYISHPLTFPVYIALKMVVLLLALLIILKIKRSSEIGEIVLLSALTFVAVG